MGHSVKGAFQCRCANTYNDAVQLAWSLDAFVRPAVTAGTSPTPTIEFMVDADNEQKLLDGLNALNKVPINPVTQELAKANEQDISTNEKFGVGLVAPTETGPTI